MRRILLALLILPLAGCSALNAFLSTPVAPLPDMEVLLPPAYSTNPRAGPGVPTSRAHIVRGTPADALAATLTPAIPASAVTPTLPPTATAAPSWSLIWQASEASFPEQHYSLAITRPHVEPASPESAWINREIGALVEADIASFEEMAAQGVLDEQYPGHLWMGFSVPSTEITESAESDEGRLQDATTAAPQVIGVAQGIALPEPLPASEAVLDLGHPLLSLLMGVSPYTGGAHPGFYHVPLTLDLTTQERIQLADLFLPGSDYLGRLSQLAIQQLEGREYIFPEILQLTPAPEGQGYSSRGRSPRDFASGAGPHPDNYRVWALSPQGLWVVFDPYQVAAWAAGPQFVLIPYAELADLLDPDGPLGREAR